MRRRKRMRKINTVCGDLKNIVKEYASRTTVHGIRYINEDKFSAIERIWWAIVFILSVATCSVFIYHILEKWSRSPVIVTFASQPTAITEIPFPAITICPGTAVRQDLLNITEIVETFSSGNLSQLGLEYEQISNLKDILFTLCPNNYLLWSTFNDSGKDFIDIDIMLSLFVLAPPIEETILGCGTENIWIRGCSHVFRPIYTNNGICYTFNGITPHELYRDEIIYASEMIETDDVIPSTWTLETGYFNNPIDSDAYPFNTIGGLFGKMFSFVLNIDKSNIISDCNMQGFKVFLHTPSDIPLHTAHFIKVPLENDVRISLSPKMTVTSDEIRSYSHSLRNCYYNSERYLSLFKVYSETNCFVECVANYTIRICGCVYFHTPRKNDTKICATSRENCVKNAREQFLSESLLKLSGVDRCDCKPACTTISYDAETHYSPADGIYHVYRQLKLNDTDKYTSSIVSVLYKESDFIQLMRSELFGKTDLVASCGGILGLFLGISLISFVEIFYFCAIRPFFYLRQKVHKSATKTNKAFVIQTIEPSLTRRTRNDYKY